MNWLEPTRYAQLSECRRYSVAKVGNHEGTMVYEAWRTRAHAEGPHLIRVNLPSAKAAQAVCAADDGAEVFGSLSRGD